MRNNNTIIIHGWMINNLNLKGNKLIAFAIVYGFSQDLESEFKGSITYLQNSLSCTRKTVIKLMSELEEDGLIFKRKEQLKNIEVNRYGITKEVVEKLHMGSVKTTHGGSVKSTHKNTNKENTKGNSIIDNNSLKTLFEKKEKPTKENFLFPSLEWDELWKEWIEHRRREKKGIFKSEKSESIAKNKLFKISLEDLDTAIQIVENSIANNYSGLFPVKKTSKPITNDEREVYDRAREQLKRFKKNRRGA